MIRDKDDQCKGGTLEIPDGYAVYNVDLDADEPFCIIIPENSGEEIKLPFPKSLAYYLTTHHNGSFKFREAIRKDAQNDLRGKFRDLMKIQLD